MSRPRRPQLPGVSAVGHPILTQAVTLHQSGRRAEAAKMYEQIIQECPRHFDAIHLLGVIALQEGRLEQARGLIDSALAINPNHAAAINNLGTVLLRSGEVDAAVVRFRRAVKLEPKLPSSLTNLGTALRQLGRPREALIPLLEAHAENPKSPTVCSLIGACLLDTGDSGEALKFFESATLLAPEDADCWGNLAVALNRTGEHMRAIECAERAVGMRSPSSATVAALASVRFEQGQIENAIEAYRQSVALPDPSSQTYCAFANALWTSGRCEEAQVHLRRAIELDENNAIARWKLAISHCQPIYDTAKQMEISRYAFSQCLDDLETWFHSARRPEAFAAVGSTQPFYLAYQPFNNKDLLSHYGELCGEWMSSIPLDASMVHSSGLETSSRSSANGRKMRVGIASTHIRDHSVWNAITKGWVRHLDRTRFDISLFHLGNSTDAETAFARREVSHFEDQPKSLQAWIRVIREASLDTLIYPEIGMDALTTQLASLRLAPVQAAAWGHPETTGLPTIDFYLSAEGLEPIDSRGNYTEHLVRLPNLGVCVEPLNPSITIPDLRSLGLPRDEPLVLCPGTPYKYSPLHDRVWARIAKGLRAASGKQGFAGIAYRFRGRRGGRLVFFLSENGHVDELFERRLRRAFDSENVDFDTHVSLIPYLDRPRFFGLMQHSSLMLDTVGFSGFNTALQAVEVGLPVLAREGDFMRGRLASGIMRRMELPELVATTDEAFIDAAIGLTADVSRLRELRLKIEQRRNIIFHDVATVRALEHWLTESIYRDMSAALDSRH